MKNNQDNYFEKYIKKQSDEKAEMLEVFFREFNIHCLLKNTEKRYCVRILRRQFYIMRR